MSNGAIYLAGILFGLGAFIHLARIFCPFEVIIAGYAIPYEASYPGFVVLALLSIYMFRSRHTTTPVVTKKAP
jgi:hypothetical protein